MAGRSFRDVQERAERQHDEGLGQGDRGVRARPRRTYLDTPRQVRNEMARVYRRMKSGEIPTQEGARMIYELERIQVAQEREANMALRYADHGYILENGRIVLDGAAQALRENEDVKEFYLGVSGGDRKSFRDVKSYKRRKRWLA
jgi:hypothetical protein